MADDADAPATATIRTHRSGGTTSRSLTKHKFRIQSAPPLSLQQYLRSATGTRPGAPEWRPSGRYHQPKFDAYLTREVNRPPKPDEPLWRPPGQYRDKRPTSISPEKRPQKRIQEPVWHPPGQYREKRPTSISPEKRPQKSIQEPVWRPAGRPHPEPVPYFDQPNLRWSLQELLRSMPEMRSKTCRSSSSMSRLRKSEVVVDT